MQEEITILNVNPVAFDSLILIFCSVVNIRITLHSAKNRFHHWKAQSMPKMWTTVPLRLLEFTPESRKDETKMIKKKSVLISISSQAYSHMTQEGTDGYIDFTCYHIQNYDFGDNRSSIALGSMCGWIWYKSPVRSRKKLIEIWKVSINFFSHFIFYVSSELVSSWYV